MRLKWISLLFIPVGLVLLMSHNTSAATTVVSLNTFNGWYGYQINNNTPVGGANLVGSLPQQIITGVNNTEKKLYGVGNKYNFNLPTGGARYDVSVRFQLYQWYQDTYYLDTPQNQKTAAWTFDDGTSTTTNCTVTVLGGGQHEAYKINFVCSYSGSKRPTTASATLGRTNSGLSGTPIMYSTRSDSSIYVEISQYWYEVITNDQQGVIDELGNIDDTLNDQFDKENAAVDNIENQQPPASGSGQNSTTSSLLDTLGSFLTAITNLSATNCNVVLAFPSFAGGSQTVNICQNKEYTGNVVSIAGSIILVLFYLPVAFMLINKIYSEIRSFTNG